MISEHLERVSGKALTALENILDLDLPEDVEADAFAVIVKAHNAAAATVLSTQTKVDENQLRKRGQDMMPEIIRDIHDFERENPTRIRVIQGGRS